MSFHFIEDVQSASYFIIKNPHNGKVAQAILDKSRGSDPVVRLHTATSAESQQWFKDGDYLRNRYITKIMFLSTSLYRQFGATLFC